MRGDCTEVALLEQFMAQFPCPHCGAIFEVQTIHQPSTSGVRIAGALDRFKLTPRLMRMGYLVLDGLSNQQIADEMGTTVQVIKNYSTRLYDAVGCGSRAEFVSMVLLGRQA